MKIISHNLKPEDMRSFDICSTDESGSFDSVPYMHSVESTRQERKEADSEDYESYFEWHDFVRESDDFIHFADEDEEVEFVVLPKDELIIYLWLDSGPSSRKIERVLKDFVGGKMVEVPAKPGWFEGAVRNFPPFNDDEHKTYVCMNGKYYTYPSELKKKGVEESRRPSRRGRMLKEGKNTEHYVWCRVGMTLKLTEDEIRKMKNGGDVGFLYEKIADAEPDGELYISAEVLDELAKVDGLSKSLCGDEIVVQL